MSAILSLLSNSENKGALLELIIEDVFIDMSLENVRKQKSGSQYGYDVVGFKGDKCWKAECKNLKKAATINDIAPKLIWHLEGSKIDKFIVVSVNGVSNDLIHLLEDHLFSFPIEIWFGEYLESVIQNSPRARKRLNLSKVSSSKNKKPLLFLDKGVEFEVTYKRGTPFSYDYFMMNNRTIKAYSEKDFKLLASIRNLTKTDVTIKEVNVRTINYICTDNIRVLRQSMLLGLIEPIQLSFKPKQFVNGVSNLIENSIIEVRKGENEYLEFNLSEDSKPGYYELIFEISTVIKGKTKVLCSPVFSLHKRGESNNFVELYVVGKYYDTPTRSILEIEEQVWSRITENSQLCMRSLGPNYGESSKNYGDFWRISTLKTIYTEEHPAGYRVKDHSESIDLNIPIEEDLFSMEEELKKYLSVLNQPDN